MSFFDPQLYASQGGLSDEYIAFLAPGAAYVDIEPLQYRRLYDWLFPEHHTNKDLYILHDAGELLSVNPAYAREKLKIPDRIENPSELAQVLYTHWEQGTVVILERNQYQAWLTDIQSKAWNPGDDLLAHSLKIKNLALEYEQDGIVLFPSPLAAWRDVNADFLKSLGTALAPGDKPCAVIVAVYSETEIWASLVLGLRAGEVYLVTTLPAEELTMQAASWKDDYARLVPVAEKLIGGTVVQGIFCERHTFDNLGITPAHWQLWIEANKRGEVISTPSPFY